MHTSPQEQGPARRFVHPAPALQILGVSRDPVFSRDKVSAMSLDLLPLWLISPVVKCLHLACVLFLVSGCTCRAHVPLSPCKRLCTLIKGPLDFLVNELNRCISLRLTLQGLQSCSALFSDPIPGFHPPFECNSIHYYSPQCHLEVRTPSSSSLMFPVGLTTLAPCARASNHVCHRWCMDTILN